ncbi:DUF7146 domain-containing protein [Rhodobacter capsulatus]|uniref:DUF7146 domain-containing protein n=1 Tax=Rhodobacter capsulatus TaxID=1061 RepID=UPI0003D39C47|nr:hypothetical protein [Rhodobacter capsulatus]ETD89825.1 hypothetical protein U713_07375 [Rhodobacter capsulatus YW2]
MSRFPDDPRPAEANARPIIEVADLLQIEVGRGSVERQGPCPRCGGKDRFGLNARKNVFLCRHCEHDGGKGGPVDLVMFVRGCTFPEALDWLCGPKPELSPAELAERQRKADERKAAQAAAAARFRAEAIGDARRIWADSVPAEGTAVIDYLARRGITREMLPRTPAALRFQLAARYMIPDGAAGWREIHRGPAMVAGVLGRDGTLTAVHRTWIDLDRPKGKIVLPRPDKPGEDWPAKKVLGAKKGGAIRFVTPRGADTLVVGEGIETTLSAMIADRMGAAYWCGVDLGNMAGQRMHGKGLKYAGIPDMDDAEAFVPPEWVRRLIYVMDGDSDPRLTRAQLLAGIRRAMVARPGLRGWIVPCPEGADLNDVLLGKVEIDATEGGGDDA